MFYPSLATIVSGNPANQNSVGCAVVSPSLVKRILGSVRSVSDIRGAVAKARERSEQERGGWWARS